MLRSPPVTFLCPHPSRLPLANHASSLTSCLCLQVIFFLIEGKLGQHRHIIPVATCGDEMIVQCSRARIAAHDTSSTATWCALCRVGVQTARLQLAQVQLSAGACTTTYRHTELRGWSGVIFLSTKIPRSVNIVNYCCNTLSHA